VNANSFRTLEFDEIRKLLVLAAGSERGKARVRELRPFETLEAVGRALETTAEAVAVRERLGRQPYHDLPDVIELLAAARVTGNHLEPRALLDLGSFVEGSVEIARRVASVASAPRLAHLGSTVRDHRDMAFAIRRAVLPSGEVSDDASPRLAETRRALARMRVQLTEVMEGYLHGRDAERILQDRLVTMRNDRYVLLVKAEHRGQLPGIIHGASGSGASLFVEPLPAVELNNDIVSLQNDERQEVVRILRDLTARVGDRAPDLSHAVEVMAELDAAQAAALLARDLGATRPVVSQELRLELRNARHPLLMPLVSETLGIPRRINRDPVPVTVLVGPEAPVLVVSGPNTGGKTVALKTVGLLSLMAQCGLFIPAAEGSILPVFRRIYADIGDDQSIAENLSTFSAHLANIVSMTRDLTLPALVLFDEIGAGTDPTEGGALGVAILEHFRAEGAMVLATTHHGLMKSWAQSTGGVACASFGYDPESYEPTYRLTLGAPGRSLALEMAERLGLPAAVVADARSRRDARELQADALIQNLEEERAALEQEKLRLAVDRESLDEARERVLEAEREVRARRRSVVESFSQELRKKSDEALRRADLAIREAAERVESTRRSVSEEAALSRAVAAREIRGSVAEALAAAGAEEPPEIEELASPVTVGCRVRVRSMGIVGEVAALCGADTVEIVVGGKRMRAPRAELVVVADQRGPTVRTAPASAMAHLSTPPRAGSAEVNLVGMRVDEALPLVDKLLDEVALSEAREVRVIHGFGQGRLRAAVTEMLRGHPHVARFRPGGTGEGGGGVTVVELRD
jgi:DNA mismatch repair protein MutS2